MNISEKQLINCRMMPFAQNYLLYSGSPYLWFYFPWFQLSTVNWGPHADDLPSDLLSEGHSSPTQTSLTSPLWVEKYTLNVSRSPKALTGNTDGIWVPKYCRYHWFRVVVEGMQPENFISILLNKEAIHWICINLIKERQVIITDITLNHLPGEREN